MDLSGLKWPLIIVVVVGIGWLLSSGGVNWMESNFTKATPGEDEARDATDEAGLTRLAGYLLYMFRYEKALAVMKQSCQRYGETGKNFWYNRYRMAKCHEKLKNYQEAYNILKRLENVDARQFDERVASRDALALRAQKLKEVHSLE